MHPTTPRRDFVLSSALTAAFALWLPHKMQAQPMGDSAKIINGYPPGGPIDVVSRKLSERLTGRWAKTVFVENKTGAAGRLALDALKAAAGDGFSMLITPNSHVTVYPHIYKKLSYDPFSDFSFVCSVASIRFAFVAGPAAPNHVQTVEDFVKWVRANPNLAQCGNAGAGSFQHFLAVLIAREMKFDLSHVPFRGGTQSAQAVAAGHLPAAIMTESSALPLVQDGKLRVLATTGDNRSAFFPHTATFRELGYAKLAQRERLVALMPVKTTSDTVNALSEQIRDALTATSVQEVWRNAALYPDYVGPAELREQLRREHDFWEPIITASGFTPEA